MEKYWASLPAVEVGQHIVKRVEDYAQYLDASGLFRKIDRSYRSYYGISDKGFDSSEITAGGVAGELKKLKVNHKRAALLTILNMATKEPPRFIAAAKGTDSDSMGQAEFAEGLLGEYERKGFTAKTKDAAELALAMTEGWLVADWNGHTGEAIRPDENGRMLKTGDAEICVKSVLDVARDTDRTDSRLPWVIIHSEVSKWELIAQFPDKASEILAARRSEKVKRINLLGSARDLDKASDLVSVFELRHAVSDTHPQGRRVKILCDGRTVLSDDDWDWPTVKANPIWPSRLHMTPMGYSPSFDLEGIQDAIDIFYSSIVTNAATFGVQNVWSKKGDGLTVTQLSSGLNHFQTLEMPPQGINLTQIPGELFKGLEMLVQALHNNSATPGATRGDPPPGIKAGNALAALISQAIQFNDAFQEAIYSATERTATDVVELIQRHATTKRPAYIVGKNQRSYFQEYDANDVSQVVGFTVERISPMFKTLGGREAVADKLSQMGMVETPEQYIGFLHSGRWEAITSHRKTKYQHVQAENDQLKKGVKPQVLLTDDPMLHIPEHDAVLHSPEARENPQVVQATLEHLQEHGVMWNQLMAQYPELMAALKIPPPPMMGPDPNAPQGDPNAAPQENAPQDNPNQLPLEGGESITLPTDPVSGEKLEV